MRVKLLTVLGVAGLLAGCASAPVVPYWNNPQWVNALGASVHKGIQYPRSAAKENFPSGTAIVVFTYDNGRLQAPRILQSTGSPVLDAAIVQQIPNIKPPMAEGLNTDTPHKFEIAVGMYAANIGLFSAIQHDLQTHVRYPRGALLQGASGDVIAGFKYRNGMVFDPKIEKSSGSHGLDHSVLHELQTVPFPKPPHWLKDKTFSFRVPFCFSLGRGACPRTEVRYVSAGTISLPPSPPCAEVGYRDAYGKVSNVHLIASSGDTDLDKHALAEAAQGKLPRPSWTLERAVSDYTVPVCSNNAFDSRAPNTNPS